MNNRDEVLSLISEMIAFVKADHEINQKEYNFIYAIALQFGIDKEELDSLFVKKIKYNPPKPEADRILQFHRLVLLMNVMKSARKMKSPSWLLSLKYNSNQTN